MAEFKFKSTKDIKVPERVIDQVIGQEEAVNVVKKAAEQRRHVLLIGEPGTGKSMLGLGLAELLPKEKLVDVLSFANPNDENQPLIRTMPAGKGREIIMKSRMSASGMFKNQNLIMFILVLIAMFVPWWVRSYYKSDIMFAAFFLGGMMFLASFVMFINLGKRMAPQRNNVPKLIVDNFKKKQAPFFDGTGAHAGALLGDVLHDPFQSGGLGTPAHERIVAGLIHRSHMGVLFIDEIATLQPTTQQDLLTALQEGKYPITGQSERSAGAMVRTEEVPCAFILIAAGNMETIKHMHPALRSRIRGYGYEIYMQETMKDTEENRKKLAVFVAQEITKDKRIPHFAVDAVQEIIEEARRRANRKGHLSLRLRELGGIIRASGDLAKEKGAKLVTREHVIRAKNIARSLEQQIADKYIERKKEYNVIITEGNRVGRVNGLAVMGSESSVYSGIILPIESQVTPGGKESEIIATGKLGEIAKEAVKNVSAIIMKYFGEDIKEKYDIYVQFLQTYEGVEGDSASIAVATSIISALKKIPIKQDTAMTGSLSVRGEVLPIGGVSSKVEAAIDAGLKNVIVPKANMRDIVISPQRLKLVNIIAVESIADVLKNALVWKGKENILRKIVG
ncbi:ATP-dependent protease LonB [Candidatus Woesearchaeota archaeon]|nr:ATP-dependent protease LonB [Candidatus Woesearchaeota archaeon]|tara:strand:+ start:4051 stop:5913 length:1863 start_codon:yes stop_codon:yes gene_type:complete